ncbi:2Fe-2S iron-sulfur cluster-binding protein [Tuwongella immobilis]|uniref:2Fe-2S ferredoxin-type domain-containing protein n=1 Tax=Tuwongella immobilis TaxID=692036 RepID=A0A6C2YJB6_9BACT|nr:2Fe-2S iron-sulfur cluster-binding protein [Tuwongella immobilis]VIP01339.1 2fe-2s ferredoxin : 2Fe-2S ferredoxin OS=Candidatus Nitrospira defluvii GN=fdxB PE=4 SV=1: Fer2 [Tuwongella immobilis]VTR98110.1 2fe-2s ferredoxin : 2Fe-2S ferredoxin OS=Candidatus Nitrospira defluvii GN=fdxB PE=4 SV=1: Fer2 [Tuwongella immobilis]
MAGVNPYIAKAKVVLPTQKFTLTIIHAETNEKTVVEVDPAQIPFGRTGLEGSIMDLAFGADVEIDHACGGVCACATCHVIVNEGLNSCNAATDDEEDQLDSARGLTPESRLACQCVPNGTQNVTVTIPSWNKNLVKEGH